MAAFFFDTSAIVKRYIAETGTAWVQGLCQPTNGHDLYLVRITEVEFASAVARRRKGGALSVAYATSILSRFQQDFTTDFAIVEVTQTLLAEAVAVADSHEIRAYDAVQLAAAVYSTNRRAQLRMSPITLISADLALNTAAATLGIPVEDPNNHP